MFGSQHLNQLSTVFQTWTAELSHFKVKLQ